ncbi:MAG: multiheme c-type cytochrome, partial [Planctomycetota bacterium]
VATNGTIFLDESGDAWPRPELALVFTGEQEGYLEPCGCAGLENQLGGLKRRHTMLKQLAAKGWPLVALDAGGLVKRFGPQAQIKYRHAVESLITLGYAGVGLGTRDLRLDLIGPLIEFDESQNPITSANVGFFGFDELFSRRYRVVEAGGKRVGFTTVLADGEARRLGTNDDLTMVPVAEGLSTVAPQLAAENCDLQVLLVYGDAETAKDLARRYPQFDWVVSALGAQVPALEARAIEGTSARLIEVGHKGQYAVVIGLYPNGQGGDADQPFRYQKVPLDHRFDDSPEMQAMLVRYQDEMQTLGLAALGAKPLPHPTQREFAGSAACADCHYEEFEIWENSRHWHATQSIVDLEPARHFDPECLSCHATGWEPQKYYPFVSGYLGLEQTAHLTANGCENCHGPAKRHADYMNGDLDLSEEEGDALTAALHMEIADNEGNQEGQFFGSVVKSCMQCHDLDNSPDFDFQKYWPHVAHGSGAHGSGAHGSGG